MIEKIKGLIKYTDCSMPNTEKEKIEHAEVRGYNEAIKDVELLLSKNETKTDIQIDKIIERLGIRNDANEYRIRPNSKGEWWIEHNEVKSAEPLRQWLKNKL